MAVSINWGTRVISVPQTFLTYLAGDRWQLDVDELRLALKDIEDSPDGMDAPDTHRHATEVTLSGVTYARSFEIINGYRVEFEDMGPHYTVVCVGANHNLGDVLVPGGVHLIIGNAAGLIVRESGVSGLTPEESDTLTGIANDASITKKATINKAVIAPDDLTVTIYDNDEVTPILVFDISADKRQRVPVT